MFVLSEIDKAKNLKENFIRVARFFGPKSAKVAFKNRPKARANILTFSANFWCDDLFFCLSSYLRLNFGVKIVIIA